MNLTSHSLVKLQTNSWLGLLSSECSTGSGTSAPSKSCPHHTAASGCFRPHPGLLERSRDRAADFPQKKWPKENMAEAAMSFLAQPRKSHTSTHAHSILVTMQLRPAPCGRELRKAWLPGGKGHWKLLWTLATAPHEYYLTYTISQKREYQTGQELFEKVSFGRWNLIYKSFKIASNHDNNA